MNEQRLLELEDIVETIECGFRAIGAALIEIKDAGHYKFRADRFEDYTKDQFGFSSSRTWQLINAAGYYEILSKAGFSRLPENESQIRPLTKIDSTEDAVTVWPQVVDAFGRERFTARDVRETVDEFLGIERKETTAIDRLYRAWKTASQIERATFARFAMNEANIDDSHSPTSTRYGQSAFEVLGVPETATASEIKAAYHRLAKRLHPDQLVGMPDWFQEYATERMKQINAAFKELSSEAA